MNAVWHFACYEGSTSTKEGRQSRDFVSVTDLTLSAAGGARVDLTQRVAATGDFRLRGLGRDFSATTAEWIAGLSFAIGR